MNCGNVIREEYDSLAGMNTKWVEVEVPETRYIEIPVVQYVDTVRHVPDRRIETVERLVEEVIYEDVIKEVPYTVEEEVVKEVPVKQTIEIPVEVVKQVVVNKVRPVEKIIEVPGEIIEVEKPVLIENKKFIPVYNDKMLPTLFSQSIQPVFRHVEDEVEIPTYDFDPVLCKVLVHIPKPVDLPIERRGAVASTHRWLNDIPPSDYNALVKSANAGLAEDKLEGLLILGQLGTPIPESRGAWAIITPQELPTEPMIDPPPVRASKLLESVLAQQEAALLHTTRSTQSGIASQIASQLASPVDRDGHPLSSRTGSQGAIDRSSLPAGLRRLNNSRRSPPLGSLVEPEYEQYLKEHHRYFSSAERLRPKRRSKADVPQLAVDAVRMPETRQESMSRNGDSRRNAEDTSGHRIGERPQRSGRGKGAKQREMCKKVGDPSLGPANCRDGSDAPSCMLNNWYHVPHPSSESVSRYAAAH